MGNMHTMDRRRFLIATSAVSGGMALGLSFQSEASAAANTVAEATPAANPEFNAWMVIGADDSIMIRTNMAECGNGAMTQGAMTVAEELNCDWSKVHVEMASTNRDIVENNVYSAGTDYNGWFAGRSSHDDKLKVLLQVGASARERLKAAAAAQWKVPVTDITVKDSVLTHTKTGRTLRFGEVAAKAAAIHFDKEPAPKPRSEWTLLGKASPHKLSLPSIVNGSGIYGMDVKVPGLVYAALKQSPVQGGKLKSYDEAAIKNMPGVLAVVTVDPSEKRGSAEKNQAPFGTMFSGPTSAVAVIAEHYWQAKKALDALPIEWDDGKGAEWKSTQQIYDAYIKALDQDGGKAEKKAGDVSKLAQQKTVVEASYLTPFCDQVTMEPLNGTAMVTPERVDVWHPTQATRQAHWIAADEAGVLGNQVFFNQTLLGGGFGRRVYGDDVRMVVAVAKKFPGRPVHTIWSREEATRQGRYRAALATKFKAGLDETGMIHSLAVRTGTNKGYSFLIGLTDAAYLGGPVPNYLIESQAVPLHIQTGPYRGPGYNATTFALETFIDECAHAAGMDPLEYRIKLLSKWPDPGWVKCLQEVRDKSGWGTPLPKGQGRGVAISNWSGGGKPLNGTTVCAVATVDVTLGGVLKVRQVDMSFDSGGILNPDAVRAQLEGGSIFGMNMTLNEELNVKDGRIVEGNYDAYPVLRIGDAPTKINIHFGGLTEHERLGEMGEAPAGVIGPAIGNAIFAATGKRLRTTPFRKQDMSWGTAKTASL